jgi:putative transposase
MARPLRIEFSGAYYHVTARGDRREPIYDDDADRSAFLDVLRDVVEDFDWRRHAYCLMTNHYHLFVETAHANLAKGMRQLDGVFTQYSNRRHGRTGHLFQGRYKAILVDSGSYLQELSRYVVLNPVRAGMVVNPGDWPWSSYRATAGLDPAPEWLTTETILSTFGRTKGAAREAYRGFVSDGIGAESVWGRLRGQIYLGDDSFVERMQKQLGDARDEVQVPRLQRRTPPPTLERIREAAESRDAAIVAAHATGAYSYGEIAEFFGLHFTTVGRIVRRSRQREERQR